MNTLNMKLEVMISDFVAVKDVAEVTGFTTITDTMKTRNMKIKNSNGGQETGAVEAEGGACTLTMNQVLITSKMKLSFQMN